MKRAWIISDTHFGYKNSSREWLKTMSEWWEEFLIPTIKENMQPGDVIIHCGDLFDIRSHTDELIRHTTSKLILNLLKLKLELIIIAGNHDVYYKHSNTISSLDSLDYRILKNEKVKILKQPTVIGEVLFAPWEANTTKLGETLQNSKSDWVFMHADIQGLRYNKDLSSLDRGIKLETLSKFKGVFSGHIHWASSIGNVHYVGSPYHMDRSEISNKKYIQLIDFTSGAIVKFENKLSPKYVSVQYSDIVNNKVTLKNNDYIDIYLESEQTDDVRNFLKENSLENFNLKFKPPETKEVELNEKIDFSDSLLNQMLSTIKSTHSEEVQKFLKDLKNKYEDKEHQD